MRKTSILLFVMILNFFALTGQKVIPFQKGKVVSALADTKPQRSIISSDKNAVVIEYSFPGGIISDMSAEGETYQNMSIEGFGSHGRPGEPSVPNRTDFVAIPDGATAKVVIQKVQYVEYKDIMLYPAQEPVPTLKDAPKPKFKKNKKLYNTNSFFPKKLVDIVEIQKLRGKPLAFVSIRPVQFNPLKKKIRVYSSIKYKIVFKKEEGAKRSDFYKSNQGFFDKYSSIVLNKDLLVQEASLEEESATTFELNDIQPEYATEALTYNSIPVNYIIITTNEFLAAADTLSQWKKQLGYTTEIVSQDTWTSTGVKNAISERYNNWATKPDYFVIIGDHEDVPGKMVAAPDDNNFEFPSDLYYACMDGEGDYIPDMAHGRISVSDAAEAMIVVLKIVNYERSPVTDASFYQNVLNRSYFQDDNRDGYSDMRFTRTSEESRNYFMNQGYSVDRCYYTQGDVSPSNYNANTYFDNGAPLPSELLKPTFTWGGSNTNFFNALNSGKFLACAYSHGSYAEWAYPSLSDLSPLSNGNKLPVILSMSCRTGGFHYPYSGCLAEKFLRHSNGGAVGFFGASELSYMGYGDALCAGFIDAIWPSPGLFCATGTIFLNGYTSSHPALYTMGDVLNQGKIHMVETTSWDMFYEKCHYERFHYFGDPAMKIWTAQPAAIAAIHEDTITSGSNTLVISSSSCPEGLVTLCHNGQIVSSAILSDGNASLYFNPIEAGEKLTLTISKHNFRPYIVEIPAVDSNIALNKPVTASAEHLPDDPVTELVDGVDIDGNRWAASGFPQWAEIDLQDIYDISSVEVVTFQNRDYQYTIDVSTDGTNYTTIIDRSANVEGDNLIDTVSATARFIKINVSGANTYTGSWCSINELKVFGTFNSLVQKSESIQASTDDQQINSDGSSDWKGQTTIRVGGSSAGVDGCAVLPFALPALEEGDTILSAYLSVALERIANNPEGNVDVYALPYRSASTVLASDFWQGTFDTDPNAAAIQDDFATLNSTAGPMVINAAASQSLISFIYDQYASGAQAGDYIFIRLNPDHSDVTNYYYWSFYTANSTSVPVLNFEIGRINPDVVHVTDIILSETEFDFYEGEFVLLDETIFPANAAEKSVTWTSDNQTVATVDQNGMVTAISPGFAQITATTIDGRHTATCEVEVIQPVTEVIVSPNFLVTEGYQYSYLTATTLPENASDHTVTWSTDRHWDVTVWPDGMIYSMPYRYSTAYATITATANKGNASAECKVFALETGWDLISFDDFEDGWGNFKDGGGDCELYTGGTYAKSGNNAAQIQDNQGVYSACPYHSSVDLSGHSLLRIEFWFCYVGLEDGEDFFVEYSDDGGLNWQIIDTLIYSWEYSSGYHYWNITEIESSNYAFTSDAMIRFRCDASQNDDQVYIDDVIVTAQRNASKSLNPGKEKTSMLSDAEILVFPNPNAGEVLHVGFPTKESAENALITIYEISGKQILKQAVNGVKHFTVDASNLSTLKKGVYFIEISTPMTRKVEKLILR